MTTLPSSIRTGGEIDSFCTKCNLNLAATIIAMNGQKVVKVECNTCHTVRMYKGVQPLVKSQSFAAPKKKAAKVTKAEKIVIDWEARLAGKDVARARKYSPKDTYKVDEVIDHPTFGLGLVSEVRIDKVDVAFKTFEKTLIHGKSGSEQPIHFTHSKFVVGGHADKPPELDAAAGQEGADPAPSSPDGSSTQDMP